jgi:hypothetical protein
MDNKRIRDTEVKISKGKTIKKTASKRKENGKWSRGRRETLETE